MPVSKIIFNLYMGDTGQEGFDRTVEKWSESTLRNESPAAAKLFCDNRQDYSRRKQTGRFFLLGK